MKLKVFSVLVCAACAGNAASRDDMTPRRGERSREDTRVLLTSEDTRVLLTSKHGHPAVYGDGRQGKGMTLATLMSFGLTGPQAREFMAMGDTRRLEYLKEHARMFGRNLDLRALESRGDEEGEGEFAGDPSPAMGRAPTRPASPDTGYARAQTTRRETGQDGRTLPEAFEDYQRLVRHAQTHDMPLPELRNRRERLAWLNAQHERDAAAAEAARKTSRMESMYDHGTAADRLDLQEMRQNRKDMLRHQ